MLIVLFSIFSRSKFSVFSLIVEPKLEDRIAQLPSSLVCQV